jgi:hypothetical protein
MITRKKDSELGERLDRIGREIVRASSANETEAENWLTMLAVIWRTVPAMALVAVFAFVLFLSAGTGTRNQGSGNDYALLGETDVGVEQVVFTDTQPLSSDDVLTTILDADEQGVSK